jgi:Ran GTPase-activating protein (RanGAP) involved in mRNA processing and transport
LGQNNIGPAGASILAKALHEANLKKLYLEGNNIGDAGAKAFYEALETMENKTLQKLFCDNNGISKDEAIRLGRSLGSATVIGDGGIFQE